MKVERVYTLRFRLLCRELAELLTIWECEFPDEPATRFMTQEQLERVVKAQFIARLADPRLPSRNE